MILTDVNILLYACRLDDARYAVASGWLHQLTNGPEPYALADVVLSGFVRISTNRSVYPTPMSIAEAHAFVDPLRQNSRANVLEPNGRQWALFKELCLATSATGNRVPDAYIASLAIANGCELATGDGDFRRFPGLRTVNPLA